MKNLNQFITEKLKINKNINSQLNYFPETREELKELINKLIKERGNNANLNDIDTSKITDMYGLFMNVSKEFNGDVAEWDVSNVENMNSMFYGCKSFNCNLSNWNVKRVKNMSFMFKDCENFQGIGLQFWKTYKIRDIRGMFTNCKKFDCDISKWYTLNIKNISDCFRGCISFKGENLENWKTKKIIDMENAFGDCKSIIKLPSWYKNNK